MTRAPAAIRRDIQFPKNFRLTVLIAAQNLSCLSGHERSLHALGVSTDLSARHRLVPHDWVGLDTDGSMTEQDLGETDQKCSRSHLINVHVGGRIRLRRRSMGLSPGELANALGVRYQQVQYYEVGRNQITSSSLHILTQILDVPISFFFDGMPDLGSELNILTQAASADPLDKLNIFAISEIDAVKQELDDLMTVYYKLKDRDTRKGIIEFLKVLGRRR